MSVRRIVCFFLFPALCFCLFSGNLLAQNSPANDSEKFLPMLNSASQVERINAAKIITRSGVTDQKVFDVIQEKLIAGSRQDTINSDHIDEMSWFCKALASSGNYDYAEILEEIASTTSSSKLRKYAKQSIGLIAEYHADRELINSSESVVEGLSPEEARAMNMLKSGKLKLQKTAAKLLTRREITAPSLYAVVNEELKEGYKRQNADKEFIDTMSWYCKALGASGNKEYQATLQEVVESAQSEKLKKYARKGLSQLK